METRQAAVLLVEMILLLSMLTLVFGVMLSTRTITNSCGIKSINVSVWNDSGLTQSLTFINWGMVGPGTPMYYTMYVKNDGNAPMTLNMSTNSWNPAAAAGNVTVSLNQEGSSVPVGGNVTAVVELQVSPSIIGTGVMNMTWNILITGSG